jgi:uncharacterized protein DUF4166
MTTHAFFDPFGAFAAEETAPSYARSTRRALSYRDLLGDAWWALPAATRARFEHHEALYTGTMTLRATAAGRWVACLCTLVGSPLPPPWHAPLAATVRVEPDRATGGSRWTRCYDFPRKRVSVASVKAVDADGALVERLSCGLRMRLKLDVRGGALCFDSAGYYVECEGLAWGGRRYGAWRVELPSWFLPGRTCVSHHDLGNGRFRFTMTIRHALLGDLFHHDGVFHAVE